MTLMYRIFGIPGDLDEFIDRVTKKEPGRLVSILTNVYPTNPSEDVPGWRGNIILSCGKCSYIAYDKTQILSETESYDLVYGLAKDIEGRLKQKGLIVKLPSELILQEKK
ncbi:hypothetical protein HYX15_03845 [Candidatus Woesearchaeota archaeon]|nr:hypothetical protein [Candidatus Woesearchaeota archaeon]